MSALWKALLVDDEPDFRGLVAEFMRMEGIDSLQAGSGETALTLLRKGDADVVLLDLDLPGISGMQVLREARKIDSCPPIIMLTGKASIDSAVEAVKHGAYDYLPKPFGRDDLVLTVRRALESRRLEVENRQLRLKADSEESLRTRMGPSDAIGKLIAEVERVAPTDFTVIVAGETGSGKELVARAIHRLSPRSAAPFIPVDCGAIQATLIESELFGHEKGSFTGADRTRPGKFEAAAGGTLFLDEVQNLPLPVQTRLLRALQERHIYRVGGTKGLDIDLRVVAASNQDLRALVAGGQFREDLFHRINEFTVTVPSLRQRRDDIIYLAKRFMDLARVELKKQAPRISSPALELLLAYPWPGNVRELRNVIRRAVLLADVEILPGDLGIHVTVENAESAPPGPIEPMPGRFDGSVSLKELVRRGVAQIERDIIAQVLRDTGGNKAKAARLLQIDYKTMQTKAREYGLSGKEISPVAEASGQRSEVGAEKSTDMTSPADF
jgi:two-component system nitrogen regulation response regulator GlnG